MIVWAWLIMAHTGREMVRAQVRENLKRFNDWLGA